MSERLTPWATRAVRALALLLLVLAGVALAAAVTFPTKQALGGDGAVALFNVRPGPAHEYLAGIPGAPGGAQVMPMGGSELTVEVAVPATLNEEATSWGYRVATTLGTAWWWLALAVMFFLMARILTDISLGSAFTRKNVRRLLGISSALIIGSVGADLLNMVTAGWIYDYLALAEPLHVVPYFSLTPWLIAALSAAVALAFESGRRIEADLEGLV